MSLIRQVWLLLLFTVTVAFVGAVGVSVTAARHYLQTQLTLKNNDAAQAMALSLSQGGRDQATAELMISSQFDTGAYERIELLDAEGKASISHRAPRRPTEAPGWFQAWLAIEPATGVALVSDGWKQRGRLEVVSQVSYAQDELWRSTLTISGWLAVLAAVAGTAAAVAVRRIRAPLSAVVGQATALMERRFVTISEPAVPELREVTRAMNGMVARLKSMFDEQAGQVDQLRRRANCDPLTGVSNRAHFMGRLKGALGSEDGAGSGALLLIRLTDLQGLNRKLGHAATDRCLEQAAAAIVESAARAGAAEVGRLNGSDFAMILSDVDSLREPAIDVGARLRSLLKSVDADSSAVVGAVRWWHGAPMSSLLAAADQALARAEGRGPYAVEIDDSADGLVLGETGWRQRLEAALRDERLRLIEFPVVDLNASMIHRECPLRIQLDEGGEWVPAAQWLPMARRVQLMARIDLAAIRLALKAIQADQLPRAVNVGPASLIDGAFLPGFRALLAEFRQSAPGLSLEVAEAGAMRHLTALSDLVGLSHAHGVHVGLEHAGDGLSESGALLEIALDFVKLDTSFLESVSSDHARRDHVQQVVRMLHGIGLKVYAEGVSSEVDAAELWRCGVDGITGPVVMAPGEPAR